MNITVEQERILAAENSKEGTWAVFKGRNFIRFIIASWPKVAQQFVGLAVFNTYATYFCKLYTWCLYSRESALANKIQPLKSNTLETKIHSELP